VLNGVSLDVKNGEFAVLLGPSGCGKTTTLRCIAGFEDPDSGDILIDGQKINQTSPKDRDVAIVFQNYALYPHLTVRDNLAFPLKRHHVPKEDIDKKVKETAALLKIGSLLSRKPRQLSGGEQQRVALGRAIIRRPRIFLMDEPLSNLDAQLRLYMRVELKRLQRSLKTTTIYVTHDQAEALAVADRIAVMNRGKILQFDTPKTLYDRPATTFVAGFIGSPPMNLIEGKIASRPNGLILESKGFDYPLPKTPSTEGLGPNKNVVIGFRPEDVRISQENMSDSSIVASIDIIEPMGSTMLINFTAGPNEIRAVTSSAEPLIPGRKMWLEPAPDKLRVYDAESGILMA
jgi:multiple sugar transport system ATP-binding protein